MFETWQDFTRDWRGLGAVLDVTAGTFDYAGNPKTVFAPNEMIYFRVQGEPNMGVLVQWNRDNIEAQSLTWEGINTDENGRAQWTRTAGPSGMGVGSFAYTVYIPVYGVSPDPKKTIYFEVKPSTAVSNTGTNTSTTTNTTDDGRTVTGDGRSATTRTQPICTAPAYYDALLGVCVNPGANTNQTNQQQTTSSGVNACTPYGLEMNAEGKCIIPRTTTERYTGDNAAQIADMQAAQLARQVKELQAELTKLRGSTTPDNSAIVALQTQIAQMTAQLTALQAIASGSAGAGGGGGDVALPTWLEGTWFGLPKPLVLGGAVLLAFMFKR